MDSSTKKLPSSFDELVKTSEKPVLVDFWAEWCAPCRTLAPIMQQVSRELRGKILVVKINVDEKQHVASAYNIQSIPTLMLFYQGKILWRVSGALPFDIIKREIESRLP